MRYNSIQSVFDRIEDSKIEKKIFAHIVGNKFTYKHFIQDVNKLGNLFQSKGLSKGDRVVLSTNEDYYTALFFIAFLRYGIVAILLDPETPSQRADAIIKKADAHGIIMDDNLFEQRNISEDSSQVQLKIKKKSQKKGRLFKRLLKKQKRRQYYF